MSSKYKRPKKAAEPIDPEKMKVRRGEIINFMNFMSQDENFCLRVWNTVQGVHERAVREAEQAAQGEAVSVPEITGLGSDAEVATQTTAEPVGFLNERDKYLNEDEGRESVPTVTEAVPA